MINNKKKHMTMLHPQQPISRRRLWGFVIGIGCHKLATSCWGCCRLYLLNPYKVVGTFLQYINC